MAEDPTIETDPTELPDDTVDDSTPDDPDVSYAPKRRKRTATPPPPPPFQLLEEPCPAGCTRGQILGFDQAIGQILHIECARCMGVGTVEVQVAGGE